jgi:transcriptional regulator
MYIPQHFIQNDPAELAELINGNNFGTLVSVVDQRPFATHLPFVYDQAAACLRAHMARSNPHWQSLASED